jgi:uncharacterized protein (TIGR04255 family)
MGADSLKEDAVPVELPAPDRRILKNNPLQQVVCQVRFDEADVLNDRKIARHFFDKLGGVDGPFPKFTQILAQRVIVNPQAGPGETPTTEQQRGWRFSNADGDGHITLLPDSLALETTSFPGWDQFAPHLQRALDVLADEADPAIEQRLGLRFVNLVIHDEVRSGPDWDGYIVADLLAPAYNSVLGPGVVATTHRVVLYLGDDLRCILNYGLAPDANGTGRPGYVLDLDVFRELSAPFSAADVFKASELMNDRAVSLFQQMVTPKLLDVLRGEEDTASQGGGS